MKLEVYAFNAPAIKAYEKAGYEPVLVEMQKSIKEPSSPPSALKV